MTNPTDREAVERLADALCRRCTCHGEAFCGAELGCLMDRKVADTLRALLASAEAERETTAQNAALIVLKDSERIGCQKSPEPVLNWRAAYDAMGQDYKECGWGDWPSILDAALRALADKGEGI